MLVGFFLLLQAVCFSLALLYESQRSHSFFKVVAAAVHDLRVMAPAGVILAGGWVAVAVGFQHAFVDKATRVRPLALSNPTPYRLLEISAFRAG